MFTANRTICAEVISTTEQLTHITDVSFPDALQTPLTTGKITPAHHRGNRQTLMCNGPKYSFMSQGLKISLCCVLTAQWFNLNTAGLQFYTWLTIMKLLFIILKILMYFVLRLFSGFTQTSAVYCRIFCVAAPEMLFRVKVIDLNVMTVLLHEHIYSIHVQYILCICTCVMVGACVICLALKQRQ